uniref:MAGUK p55 subfamily member 6 n=1 Tax=Syphacia muris TaxID=451379 RepID=A0A0N5AQX4_9BILA
MEQEVAQLRSNADNLAQCLHSLLERIEQLEGCTTSSNRMSMATSYQEATNFRPKSPDETDNEPLKKVEDTVLVETIKQDPEQQISRVETTSIDPETGLKEKTVTTKRMVTTKSFHAIPVDAKPLTSNHILASAYESRLVNVDNQHSLDDIELELLGNQIIVTSVRPGSEIEKVSLAAKYFTADIHLYFLSLLKPSSKDIHAGDTIVEVNGQSITDINDLKGLPSKNISLKLVPAPIHQAPSVFYRVLADYDADKDETLRHKWAGLNLKRGEIIQVICNNDEWLQARKVNDVSRVGLVPSSQIIEKVGMLTPYGRRVLILLGVPGVGRRTIKSMLLSHLPQYFSTVTPLTSRPPKPNEQEGREYHFLKKEEMQKKIESGEMIEWGEYVGNYYGTSAETVRACVRSGRVCVLDCAPQALQYLYNREFMPFVVVISPPNIDELRHINKLRPNPYSDEQLQQTIADNRKLLSGEYSKKFHLVLTNRNSDITFRRLQLLTLYFELIALYCK